MHLPRFVKRTDLPTRVIVLGRLAACLLLLLYHIPMGAAGFTYSPPLVVGVTLYVVWTIAWLIRALMRPDGRLMAMLTATALIDGVALGMLTAATCGYRDPFLGWYMVETALFGLLLRRRRAWILGGVLAISYLSGHVFSGMTMEPIEHVFVAVNVLALLSVAMGVSLIFGGQEERRVEVEAQRSEVVGLNRRLERSVSELRAVTEITELIHSTLEIESVGPILLNILEKVIDIPAASLYAIDKAKQETVFATSSIVGGGTPRAYSGLELAGTAPLGSSDGALSCIELVDHPNTLVVFCAETEAIDGLTTDDRIVLQAVASELVVAVENSRLYRLTKRLAITDELTDLYNYRFLQQRLDDEIGRADRYRKRLSLLMLDLDNFKSVNDTHGHLVGDSVLAEIGQLLKVTVREVDIVARYGGEEFSVILPETDASGAFIVAEKIRESVSLHRFSDVDGERTIHVTASIGLANYPVHATDKESLLRAADDALYRAKETGKDRVRAPRLRLGRLPVESDHVQEVSE